MSEEKLVMTGTIVAILPAEEISNGKYRKQVFIIKNDTGYEGADASFALELFEKSDGKRIANFSKFNKVGDFVDVQYEIRCNENGGRWFTSLSAWRIDKNGSQASAPAPADEVLDEEPPF